jgi:hypothetical protein
MVSSKRRHSRRDIINTIEFFLVPLAEDEILYGVIVNISDSGFCMLTTNHLKEGQKITMQNAIAESSQTAMVRWSERCNNLYSKSGLEFV